jgi:hypothetical protein
VFQLARSFTAGMQVQSAVPTRPLGSRISAVLRAYR